MILQKIKNNSNLYPNKQAIVYNDTILTYTQLWNEIEIRSNYIFENIIEKNVIFKHTNSLENLLNFLAGIAAGKVGIFGAKLSEVACKLLSEQINAKIFDKKIDLSNRNQNPKNSLFSISEVENQKFEIFLGILTSGTISQVPKVIWKDYQSWVSAFQHQSDIFDIDENNRLFVLDALDYSANLNSVLHMLWQGGTIVLTSLASSKTWQKQIENNKISTVFMVPSHYRLLLKNKSLSEDSYYLKSAVSAGEKLDITTASSLLSTYKNITLTEYYGAAELGHISYHQNENIVNFPLSVGKPFPQVDITIENENIIVESPYISPEFRNKKTVLDKGFFEGENLILTGRAGRVFNKRGLNVFAEEIENAVKTLPEILEAVAIGKINKSGSHDIMLAFSTLPNLINTTLTEKEVKTHLLNILPATKRPQKIKHFTSLPRKNIGKIDYSAIAKVFAEEENS